MVIRKAFFFLVSGIFLLFHLAIILSGIKIQTASGVEYNSAATITQDDGTTIRVLVVYTPAARDAAGGVVQMEEKILRALDLMNESFANSAVNAQVVLAGAQEAAYTQSEEDLVAVLDYLRNPFDTIMDNVHLLRDQRYADLVSLVVGPGTADCYNGYQLASEGAAFAPLAFSIVREDCMITDLGLLQALGKNMGAHEDWYVDISNTPPTFRHGYIYIDDAAQTGWRTVMTNRLQCDQHGIACDHLPYWSNPQVNYQGQAMGVAEGTKSNCSPGSDAPAPCDADNARILNLNANSVANFRQGAPTPAEILLVNDEGIAPPEFEVYYTQALQSLQRSYDIHSTGISGADEPNSAELAAYTMAIWFTGHSRSASTGPGAAGEAALAAWLDQGGCLLLSSRDYAYALGGQPTMFIQQYLGVLSADSDSGYALVTGSGPFSGLGPYTLNDGVDFNDSFQPVPGALAAFTIGQGSAALFNLSPTYRTTYFGFPLENLTVPAGADVLQRFFNTCQFWRVYLPVLNSP